MVIQENYDYAKGIFNSGYGQEANGIDEQLLREKGVSHNKICFVKDVEHKREVMFVKPDFWLVRDTIGGKDIHQAEQIWHFYDGEVTPDASGQFMMTNFSDTNLIMASAGKNDIEVKTYKGSQEPFRGWHCPYYDQMRPAPEVAYTQKGTNQIVFHTLIFPVLGEAKVMPRFEITSSGYLVCFQGRKWEISAPENSDWHLL